MSEICLFTNTKISTHFSAPDTQLLRAEGLKLPPFISDSISNESLFLQQYCPLGINYSIFFQFS